MNRPEHKQFFISRRGLPLMTFEVKFTQFLWVRRGEPATEPYETRICFVKLSACLSHHILFLPFTGSPHWAYFLKRHQKFHLFKPQSSGMAEFPVGSPDLAHGSHSQPWWHFIFLFRLPCLPVSEPNQESLHYKLSVQGGTFPMDNCRHNCSKHPNPTARGCFVTLRRPGSHLHVPPEHGPWMLSPEELHEAFMNNILRYKDPSKRRTILLSSHLPRKTL